jgi:hypothetical protein
MQIKQVTFPESQYIREEHPKKQIYLHHTAGNPNGENVFKHWESNVERVATCVTISGIGKGCKDGEIVQGFQSKFWGFHLGLQESTFHKAGLKYKSLDRISIGIEICNWGQLTLKDGKYYNYVNGVVPESQVIKLTKKYKGHQYFHNYTDAQIESVKKLLLLWKEKYGIPLKYNEDIWDICPRALAGEKGVFTHNSVRRDKIDIYPHPKMIEMLKSI